MSSKHRPVALARLLALTFWALLPLGSPAAPARAGQTEILESFVAVNGVELQVLDWGGSGPTLILIHGLGDDPHCFDDLAPGLTDRFHVIAYARRGFGGSSGVAGPYDVATLTDDLRGLMDALGIRKADLAGVSAGGDEITEMAAKHPERVRSIVYLDGAYDWADPDWRAAMKALPATAFDRPPAVMASLDAFRTYQRAMWYPELTDMRRVEPLLREKIVIQSDGRLRDRIPRERIEAHLSAYWANKPRDYAHVTCPALAIYAATMYDLHTQDLTLRENARVWERTYWAPFQAKSIDRARRELANVQIVRIPGAHVNFLFMERGRLTSAMRSFLGHP